MTFKGATRAQKFYATKPMAALGLTREQQDKALAALGYVPMGDPVADVVGVLTQASPARMAEVFGKSFTPEQVNAALVAAGAVITTKVAFAKAK